MDMNEAQAWVIIIGAVGAVVTSVVNGIRMTFLHRQNSQLLRQYNSELTDNTQKTEQTLIATQNNNRAIRQTTEALSNGFVSTPAIEQRIATTVSEQVGEHVKTIAALEKEILSLREQIIQHRVALEREKAHHEFRPE